MSKPIEILLQKLSSARRNHEGTMYRARCPAHNDHKPSLLFGENPEGRVWVRCMKGCKIGYILAALGITDADLQPVCSSQAHATTSA